MYMCMAHNIPLMGCINMKVIRMMPMMAWGCVGTWPALSATEKIMTKPAMASNTAVIWGVKEEVKKEVSSKTQVIPSKCLGEPRMQDTASTATTVVNFTFQTDNSYWSYVCVWRLAELIWERRCSPPRSTSHEVVIWSFLKNIPEYWFQYCKVHINS